MGKKKGKAREGEKKRKSGRKEEMLEKGNEKDAVKRKILMMYS